MKKLLVVVDMQNDFTTGSLGNAQCAAVIPEIVSIIHDGTYDKILFTKDTHQSDYLQTQEGQKLPVVHCIEGTKGWEIVPAIAAAAEKKETEIICKPSFGSVMLGEKLAAYSEKYKETLEIDFCGVCTGICVISNVLLTKAFVPEAKICVIAQACACVTPQSHQTAIEAMKTCQVEII